MSDLLRIKQEEGEEEDITELWMEYLISLSTTIPPEEENELHDTLSKKRKRGSNFSDDIHQRLNKSFYENNYPNAQQRESIAKECSLTSTQVHNWFKNQRRTICHQEPTIQKHSSNKGLYLSSGPRFHTLYL